MLKRKTDSDESKEYWEFADKMLKRVENYPDWKKGGENAQSNEGNERSCRANSSSENGHRYNLK